METTTMIDFVIEPPNVAHLVTEDDTPVDNNVIFSEKQQRLLVDAIFSSNPFGNRPFVASANVSIYYAINKPIVVPDIFLSLENMFRNYFYQKWFKIILINANFIIISEFWAFFSRFAAAIVF